jgi:hypothetical protein
MTLEEKRKIKQAAATFVVLFVLFNILISARILTHRLPQNQWQLNTIRAETYVFKKNTWKYVVLGSSLTFRIAPGVDRRRQRLPRLQIRPVEQAQRPASLEASA